MRSTAIFSGSSHPQLVDKICDWLGESPAKVKLSKFKNGETQVEIESSVRDKNVFIVQSGSTKMNDSLMELLIMIDACKGGSSKSVTAVIPYFPYSRQSKKKAHRSAITARMVANLLHVAGVTHVITIDLHASQMQGFFRCPVDNLVAEPILAKWIRTNVKDWKNAVVISKNPGGTKRVTSLADALHLSFGIITTDRRKPHMPPSMYNSVMLDHPYPKPPSARDEVRVDIGEAAGPIEHDYAPIAQNGKPSEYFDDAPDGVPRRHGKQRATAAVMPGASRVTNGASYQHHPSPLAKLTRPGSSQGDDSKTPTLDGQDSGLSTSMHRTSISGTTSNKAGSNVNTDDEDEEEFTDERARNVITGRLIHGHLVDDDYPSPSVSAMTFTTPHLRKQPSEDEVGSPPEHMHASFTSERSAFRNGIGGSGDATASDDEEEDALEDPELETTITLVGNVRGRPVLIVDDILDKPGSWIAAAETAVKKGGATKVYCMATHGLFTPEAFQRLEACDEIEKIIVTNTFPVVAKKDSKLHVEDVSHLLSEAIRRNAHGESIEQLFMHYE